MVSPLSHQFRKFSTKNNTFFLSVRFYDREGYLYGQREHSPSDTADFTMKSYKDGVPDAKDPHFEDNTIVSGSYSVTINYMRVFYLGHLW